MEQIGEAFYTGAGMLWKALMILYAYVLTKFWFPEKLAKAARKHAEKEQAEGMEPESAKGKNWQEMLTSRKGWAAIGRAFFMEWKMVYKEILCGFTVAGFIAVLCRRSFGTRALIWLQSQAKESKR